jgi:glycerol kinase
MAGQLVGAIDQGTTSTRFLVVDADGAVVSAHQSPHTQHQPQPGWLEHDPQEVWAATVAAMTTALRRAGLRGADLAAVGVTNQRETVLAWDVRTGRPYHRAIVWADTRTEPMVTRLLRQAARDGVAERLSTLTGLRPSSYFSALKIRWLLEHVPAFAQGLRAGDAVVGTMDSWLLWQLTGGRDGGVTATDVTNASRTLLMGLASGAWEPELFTLLGLPVALRDGALPAIRPSVPAEPFGWTRPDGPLGVAVPVRAILGDQQAALVGQACFAPGTVKSTYGTGSFVLAVTGTAAVGSRHGLLSTVARQVSDGPMHYALEGSIAATGAAVAWLSDQLGLIDTPDASAALAATVPDTAGVYLVPAFSGLYAPYWRPDARGVVVGLSRYATAAHLTRATLEAIGYQTRDVLEAMQADLGAGALPAQLRVDGGVTGNALCMQLQADILGIPVVRPAVLQTTALGAAFAAGLGAGVWTSTAAVEAAWRAGARWEPTWSEDRRESAYAGWRKAVSRSLDWLDA